MLLSWKIWKTGIATELLQPGTPAAVEIARALEQHVKRLFGRALAIREVDAGSCNGCEIEIAGLASPIYDMERFGMHFVASPRHADMLLVTVRLVVIVAGHGLVVGLSLLMTLDRDPRRVTAVVAAVVYVRCLIAAGTLLVTRWLFEATLPNVVAAAGGLMIRLVLLGA